MCNSPHTAHKVGDSSGYIENERTEPHKATDKDRTLCHRDKVWDRYDCRLRTVGRKSLNRASV